ncbi:MAG: metallopeptidase family protein [Acidobacteriota bacterium]|nr:metallopeptidase family protein [Acidobacteriota bacterium]
MLRMSREDFERVVAEALDDLPGDLAVAIENVAVTVEEEPSDDEILGTGLDPERDTLLGLYQGVPLGERGPSTYGPELPDRIVVYRLPLLDMCRDRRELLREIRDTVVHEFGHYFGLPEEELP